MQYTFFESSNKKHSSNKSDSLESNEQVGNWKRKHVLEMSCTKFYPSKVCYAND